MGNLIEPPVKLVIKTLFFGVFDRMFSITSNKFGKIYHKRKIYKRILCVWLHSIRRFSFLGAPPFMCRQSLFINSRKCVT